MPHLSQYDHDPEAIAWARAKVQQTVDKYRYLSDLASAFHMPDQEVAYAAVAQLIEKDLLGTPGSIELAQFDTRLSDPRNQPSNV